MDKYIQKTIKYFIYYRIQNDYKSDESDLLNFAEKNELSVEGIFHDNHSEWGQLRLLLHNIEKNEAQGIICDSRATLFRFSYLHQYFNTLVKLNSLQSIIILEDVYGNE